MTQQPAGFAVLDRLFPVGIRSWIDPRIYLSTDNGIVAGFSWAGEDVKFLFFCFGFGWTFDSLGIQLGFGGCGGALGILEHSGAFPNIRRLSHAVTGLRR